MNLLSVLSLFFSLGILLNAECQVSKDFYRSDQFRPGVISEYIEVKQNETRDSILSISYKHVYRSGSSAEESSIQILELRQLNYYSGEEQGWEGQLKLPEGVHWLPFRIAEGVFEIQHDAESFQVFEKEE
jgi:hypothetical protein